MYRYFRDKINPRFRMIEPYDYVSLTTEIDKERLQKQKKIE